MKYLFLIFTIWTFSYSAATLANNPFLEGTDRFELSEALPADVIAEMKLYLNNTKDRLQTAIKKSMSMTHLEATVFLKEEIRSLVLGSKGRAELLMRVALNQAYDLVFGLPDLKRDPSGRTNLYPPALEHNINRHLSVSVLRRLMSTALEFYQSDYEALESRTLIQIPSKRFARTRLNQTVEWLPALMNHESFLNFLLISCQHIKNILVKIDRAQLFVTAEYLLKLEEIQAQANAALLVHDSIEREGRVRELSSAFSELQKGLQERLK